MCPSKGTNTTGSWKRPGKTYCARTPRLPAPVLSTAWPRRCSSAWAVGEAGGCPNDLLTSQAWPTCHPQKPFTPAKYFSIDRVFRNETLDATHLAEFHQIEGVVADHGLTLGHLMGILREFFTKLGRQAGCGGRSSGATARGPAARLILHSSACPPASPAQVSPSCASSRPTTPTRSPAWRCSATTKVRVEPGNGVGRGVSAFPQLSLGPCHCQAHPPRSLPDPASSTHLCPTFYHPYRSEEVGRSREFWALPPRDAVAHGAP